MKLRNKLSRRAQVISAIAVALVFGGGWLVVWKWPHLKLRYVIARTSPELRAAMAKRAPRLDVPKDPPSHWIPIDLGIASISVPPPIEKIEAQGRTGVLIKARGVHIQIGDLFKGREIGEDPRAGLLFRLYSNGHWRAVGFMEFSRTAHSASSADFRWDNSWEELLALQQLLIVKMSRGQVDTRLFSTPHTQGMVSVFLNQKSADGDVDFLPVLAAPNDERDYVLLWCHFPANTGGHAIPELLASIRFPNERYGGSDEDLARHIASIATTQPASTQPAQP